MKNLPLLLILLGVVLGCGNSSGNKPSTTPTSGNQANTSSETQAPAEVPPIVVSAKDLVKAYKENELAADEKYRGKKLQVAGKITGIASVLSSIQVDLQGKDFVTVKCSFPEERKAEVAKLKNGQNVTLLGTGDGMTATLYVGLNDCWVK
jgi:hypothetical protein